MSGLLALLDDVAGIAKVAAASVDDVAGQAAKAGAKAAGALIDDAAVTPKYVQGFHPSRELPIIGRIALGSIRNKLLILLPAALALSAWLPGAVAPLLMLGGAYLCYEGAEKVLHSLAGGGGAAKAPAGSGSALEEAKVAGAIKTDFILSAEIMTIALAAIPQSGFWMEAATLTVVGVGVTVVVYGSVAVIVKADDLGLLMCRRGRFAITRRLGRAIVRGMPGFLRALTIIGTAAMLWVGGAIIVHGLEELGAGWLGHNIEAAAEAAGQAVPPALEAAAKWSISAALSGALGLALGAVLLPLGQRVVTPLWRAVTGGRASGGH